jgi:hypothetical protein
MTLNPTTPSAQPSISPGCKVFDVSDSARRGKVITAGVEVSEVRFDDGAERNVPNAHLRAVEPTEVELDNPVPPSEPPVHAAVRQGQEAWQRLRSHSTWEDWKKVGAALVIGRAEAMRDGHVNKPRGRSYNAAINAFLKKFGFDGLDSGDRSRLLDVMDSLKEIDGWLQKLPESERLRLNHPSSVWRRWKASKKEKDPNRVSPVQKLKDALVAAVEERDRLKREVESGGGDLWRKTDRVKDISKVMIDQLGKTKAARVAHEILAALKEAK